jgi:hypothetical protein
MGNPVCYNWLDGSTVCSDCDVRRLWSFYEVRLLRWVLDPRRDRQPVLPRKGQMVPVLLQPPLYLPFSASGLRRLRRRLRRPASSQPAAALGWRPDWPHGARPVAGQQPKLICLPRLLFGVCRGAGQARSPAALRGFGASRAGPGTHISQRPCQPVRPARRHAARPGDPCLVAAAARCMARQLARRPSQPHAFAQRGGVG